MKFFYDSMLLLRRLFIQIHAIDKASIFKPAVLISASPILLTFKVEKLPWFSCQRFVLGNPHAVYTYLNISFASVLGVGNPCSASPSSSSYARA